MFAVARFTTAVVLLWTSVLHWPHYTFYMIIRAIVCAVCVCGAVTARRLKDNVWLWTFGIIAVLFNPIIVVHLSRPVWLPINIVTGIALLISLDGKIFGPKQSAVRAVEAATEA